MCDLLQSESNITYPGVSATQGTSGDTCRLVGQGYPVEFLFFAMTLAKLDQGEGSIFTAEDISRSQVAAM